ncbi:MAG: Zn-dependent exopeptidase M28 [Spirochaetaceae bacterium]|nr:Zn-dependent exopeptidase M28 [Spirochaetaceae bacterium]
MSYPPAQNIQILYQRFKEFIAPETERYYMLRSLLEELRLDPQAMTISGNRHLFLSSQPPSQGAFLNQMKPPWARDVTILVAHYDRAPNSPGANDNGAAVFELIEAALKLREEQARQWFIIFTDKEELSQGEGIRDQGSYTLAKGLRDAGLENSRFYIFDACGVGDTLIISTMADHLMKQEKGAGIIRTRMQVRRLRAEALEAARRLHLDRVRLIPTPFSDDAGFLRAGIAAQTITMLPFEEAAAFGGLLRINPSFADALVNKEARNRCDIRLIPETWRRLNGPEDTDLRLTPQYFSLMVRFICALCKGV